MRQPTPLDRQLAWWRNAIKTSDYHRDTDVIPCGWFRAREAPRSKTWIPAQIYLEQTIDLQTGELTEPERHVLEIEGRRWTDQATVWERSLYLEPIPLDEFRWLKARRQLHRIGWVRP